MASKNYDYSSEEFLDNIARDVSQKVRGILKNEMTEKIKNEPYVTKVDYRDGSITTEAPSKSRMYDMYSHTTSDGSISEKRITPTREEYVEEIETDGTSTLSLKKDYLAKREKQQISSEEKSELTRIVRLNSPNKDMYDSANERADKAYKIFDSNKYIIEETASRLGVPASLLSALYFDAISDDGKIENKISTWQAERCYFRLYGKFPISQESLREYMNTTEGALDMLAVMIKSESSYFDTDPYNLSPSDMTDFLNNYKKHYKAGPAFNSSILAYEKVFEKLFKKMPDKKHSVGF